MSTGLIEYQNKEAARFGYVRDGIAGNYDVVHKMVRLVRDSVILDKGLEDFAKHILISAGLDSHSSTTDIFTAIYRFIQAHVKYIQDIEGRTESIKDARTTLNDGYGDCDDLAILAATLLAMNGYEPKFVIAKYDNDDQSNFQHVYTVVYNNGERYIFDTSLEYGELNDEVETTGKAEIGVFDYLDGVDGINGVIQSFKDLVTGTKSNALGAIGAIGAVLPMGLIPAHALSLGAAMLGTVGSDHPSLSETGSKISGKMTDLIIELGRGKIALQIAQRYAQGYIGEFYAALESTKERETPTKDYIEKQLLKKLSYINNYGSNYDALGQPAPVSLNLGMMQVLGIAAIGIAGFYFFKKQS